MPTTTLDPALRETLQDLFREAALKGTPQLVGIKYDWLAVRGYCAVGLIETELGTWMRLVLRNVPVPGCHLCGAVLHTLYPHAPITELDGLLVHLNNDHRLDWLGLAKALEPEALPHAH